MTKKEKEINDRLLALSRLTGNYMIAYASKEMYNDNNIRRIAMQSAEFLLFFRAKYPREWNKMLRESKQKTASALILDFLD